MVGFVARRPVIVIECDAFSQKPIKIASTRGGEANFSSSSGFKSSASLGPRDYTTREKKTRSLSPLRGLPAEAEEWKYYKRHGRDNRSITGSGRNVIAVY
jgi:hypothetical protein